MRRATPRGGSWSKNRTVHEVVAGNAAPEPDFAATVFDAAPYRCGLVRVVQ